jgi:hypothetical protein
MDIPIHQDNKTNSLHENDEINALHENDEINSLHENDEINSLLIDEFKENPLILKECPEFMADIMKLYATVEESDNIPTQIVNFVETFKDAFIDFLIYCAIYTSQEAEVKFFSKYEYSEEIKKDFIAAMNFIKSKQQ